MIVTFLWLVAKQQKTNSSSDTDGDSERPAEPHTSKITKTMRRNKFGVNDNYIYVVSC